MVQSLLRLLRIQIPAPVMLWAGTALVIPGIRREVALLKTSQCSDRCL